MKILIADDESDVRASVGFILDRLGCRINKAINGSEAKELLKTNKYDYIFLDINMPELSGIELIKEIKTTSPNTIIIIMTGYSPMEKDFAIGLGAHKHIQKPFSSAAIERINERPRSKLRGIKKKKQGIAASSGEFTLVLRSFSVVGLKSMRRPRYVRQEIPFTDFPEGILKMYLIDKVLLLPSEY